MKFIWIVSADTPQTILKDEPFSFTWTIWYLNLTGRMQTIRNRIYDLDTDELIAEHQHPIKLLWFGSYRYRATMTEPFDTGEHRLMIESSLIG